MRKIYLNFFVFLNVFYLVNSDFLDMLTVERECRLIDLPISQLLKIKRSVEELNCSPNDHSFAENKTIDKLSKVETSQDHSALPLIGEFHHQRSSQVTDPWNERPSKIQTVFQVSITALAFLAFGGYLLCMIVQAIKSKGTTYLHSMTGTNTNSGTINTLKRIKVYRRTRRNINRVTQDRNNSEKFAGPTPEELFKVLTSVAEGYVKITSIQ